MLGELSVNEFLSTVRTQSLPGGGSVAALAGALAASLLGKVCQLTVGRDEFLEYEEQTREIQVQCSRLDTEFSSLMELDAESYMGVMAAYKLPKGNTDEIENRKAALETAWKEAVEIPCRIARECRKIIDLSKPLIGKSNKTTTADVAMAAHLAYGALEASVIIIKDNLAKVKDQAYVVEKTEWADDLAADAALHWEGIKLEINNFCGCTL